MSNIIQIKRGENKPVNGTLAPYELGYATSDGQLYIGGMPPKDGGETTVRGIKVERAEMAESAEKAETAGMANSVSQEVEVHFKSIKVDNAVNADHATEARSAEQAQQAESAEQAQQAESAKRADQATNATNAINADNFKMNSQYVNYETLKSTLLNVIYPVGSIYMSVKDTSPANLFGGTWERLQDRFLLAAGSSYKAGETGGEASHKLVINEMPSHNHGVWQRDPNYTITGNSEYQAMVDPAGTGEKVKGWAPALTKTEESSGKKEMMTKLSGGNLAHNNMPPYLVVYIWKRTA